MWVYNLLMLLIILLGIFLYEVKKFKWSNTVFFIIVSAAMVVISSLRADTVGIDYKMYETYYQQVRSGGMSFLASSANPFRIEIGYGFLNYVVSRFTPDVRVFMAIVSVLFAVLTSALIYKYSPVPWISVFVFVSFGFFGNTLSFIRQSIAIAIFLFSIKYIKEKKLSLFS